MARTSIAATAAVPDDSLGSARMEGGEENESTPMEQRAPVKVNLRKLDAGPKVGSKGEYQPATYKTIKGNIRTDR